MALAASGGRADFFDRDPVGGAAPGTMNNMKIGLIHLIPHTISIYKIFHMIRIPSIK